MSTKRQAAATSFLSWYSNNIGSRLDQICACGSGGSPEDHIWEEEDDTSSIFGSIHGSLLDIESDESVSRALKRSRPSPATLERLSCHLFEEQSSARSIHRNETMPIKNTTPRRIRPATPLYDDASVDDWEIQRTASFLSKDETRDACATPASYYFATPTKASSTLRYPHSPGADTYTTVSMSHSYQAHMDEDDEENCEDVLEEMGSTVSAQALPCFRKGTTKDSYPGLLRMKPQNYIHGEDSDEDCWYQEQHEPCTSPGPLPVLPHL